MEIILLQRLAYELSNSFTDHKKVIKSQVPAVNTPIKMDVPEWQYQTASESKERLQRERPIGSKYNNPLKRKGAWMRMAESRNEILRISKRDIKHDKKEFRYLRIKKISNSYVMYETI